MITLDILDSVNCQFRGLNWQQKQYIIEATKIPVEGAHMTAAFKTGNWDGKESLFQEDGNTFLYMASVVFDLLEEIGIDVDEIDFNDKRPVDIDIPDFGDVCEDIIKDETGFSLREHQTRAVNVAMQELKGVILASTSSGKTAITLAISKILDPHIKVLITVPSKYLADQTYEYYENSGLSVVRLGDIPPKKRAKAIEDHRHIICTNKMLQTSRELFDGLVFALIRDEVHEFGEVDAEICREELRNCPIRLGLTGSLPTSKMRQERIKAHLGGEVLIKISPKEMTDKKIVSEATIDLILTENKTMQDLSNSDYWDWEAEFQYYMTNEMRLDGIAHYIKNLPEKNTLILCHPQAGEILCKHFNGRNITEETKNSTRREWLSEFDSTEEPYYLCASFGTAATGVSVNQIQRVVLLDIGKTETLILQAVGRGMRLDGKTNKVEILDITSNTKYGLRHRDSRIKLYKREKFKYNILSDYINIED